MKTYDAPVASTTNTGTPVHCASNESKREDVLASIGRQGLVVVAGTGISISAVGDITPEAAVAGWPGLLMHGVNHCRRHQLLTDAEAEIVERQIKNGVDTRATASFVDAAQKIHDSLKGRVNGRQWWLAESIGKLKVKEARLIRAIQGLGGLIATLNYDSLFEQVTSWPPVEWRQKVEITRYIHNREREYILHLHGHWEAPESIILDRLSYEKIRTDTDMQHLLRTFALYYTMLFVGCGNTFFDPNFQTLLNWAEKSLNGVKHRHFILCRQSDEPEVLQAVKTHGYLETLVYGEDYVDLAPFLEALGNESGASAIAVNPPVSPTVNILKRTNRTVLTPAEVWSLQSHR